jgi:hypothetical protein
MMIIIMKLIKKKTTEKIGSNMDILLLTIIVK